MCDKKEHGHQKLDTREKIEHPKNKYHNKNIGINFHDRLHRWVDTSQGA